MAEEEKIEAAETAEVSEAAEAAETTEVTPASKKKNKTKILFGVIGVILLLGIGFFVWHEQPSFCNAICHTPMDAYGDTYLKGDVDKYGNSLSEKESLAMMSLNHKVNANAGCMNCHEPVLGQQISEGMHWVTGSYEIEGENQLGQALLSERTLDELVTAWGGKSGDEFCLKAGCHVNDDGSVMTRDDLLAKTAGLSDKYNPHKAQHGEIACGQCHKGHSQSLNYCTQCHTEAPVPDGWLTYQQAQSKATVV